MDRTASSRIGGNPTEDRRGPFSAPNICRLSPLLRDQIPRPLLRKLTTRLPAGMQFWDTAPAYVGSAEVWAGLKAACAIVASNEPGAVDTAQAILGSLDIKLPNGSLTVAYDVLVGESRLFASLDNVP